MLLNEAQPKLDRRVKRTRKLLQQAFGELLAEQDFHSITVQDIVERADVNRATFYAHFDDKFALLSFSVRGGLEEQLARRLPGKPTFTAANLRLLAVTLCEFLGQFYGNCHPNTRDNAQQAVIIAAVVQQQIYEILLEWIAPVTAAPFSTAIRAEYVAVALSWLIFGTALEEKRPDHERSAEQLADQMLSFLAPSLQTYFVQPVSE